MTARVAASQEARTSLLYNVEKGLLQMSELQSVAKLFLLTCSRHGIHIRIELLLDGFHFPLLAMVNAVGLPGGRSILRHRRMKISNVRNIPTPRHHLYI